jgi:hypothetical protein
MLLPIFALLLATVGTAGSQPSKPLARAVPASGASTTAEQYRNKRDPYRTGAKRAAKPRYYSFKTKRGVTILCKTTWRGSQSTRTCWPRH